MASLTYEDGSQDARSIEFRSSTRAFLLKSGAGWLTIAATALTAGMAAVVTAPIVGFKLLNNITSKYWLEGDRLFMRRGIIFRSEEEIELYRIKDVKVSFSIIQQMFGNGNISIISSDATSNSGFEATFVIPNVEEARGIREELRARTEAARRNRGVREYDIS